MDRFGDLESDKCNWIWEQNAKGRDQKCLLQDYASQKEDGGEMTKYADLEGKFAVSTPLIVKRLNRLLRSEYAAWLTYTNFGFRLKGLHRDSVKKIFDEHAEEELEHANKLALRITALRGIPTVKMDPIPPASSIDEMLLALIKQEQEALYLYRDTLRLCGHNEGLRQNIETIIEDEQEHADEISLLRGEG